jgi:hypothetical protein
MLYSNTRAWELGFDAFGLSKKLHDNPFNKDETALEYKDWAEGWHDANWLYLNQSIED